MIARDPLGELETWISERRGRSVRLSLDGSKFVCSISEWNTGTSGEGATIAEAFATAKERL